MANGKIEMIININDIPETNQPSLVLWYYNSTSSSWMKANETCSPPELPFVSNGILAATVCAYGQYSLYIETAGLIFFLCL